MKKRKNSFTLLEILIAVMLIGLASGVLVWKMTAAIQKKRFESKIKQLESRVVSCSRLAQSTQTDFRIELLQKNGIWIAKAESEEEALRFSPLKLDSLQVEFNGVNVDGFALNCFASGAISPMGRLEFRAREEMISWELASLLKHMEGSGKDSCRIVRK